MCFRTIRYEVQITDLRNAVENSDVTISREDDYSRKVVINETSHEIFFYVLSIDDGSLISLPII